MSACTAFDDEAAVETHQEFDPFVGKEVITDSDERTNEIAATEHHRQPCRIEHDIPMVGHEKRPVLDVRLYLLAIT